MSDNLRAFYLLKIEILLKHEDHEIEDTPENKVPVGAMPQASQEPHNKQVEYSSQSAPAIAAKRDINILSKPATERHMPASPEFGDIAAEVGDVEVAHQFDSKQFGRTDGNVAVAGEVSINLEREQDGGEQQGAACLRLVGGKDLIHIDGAVVRHDHFLEEAPEDLPHAVHASLIIKRPGLGKLGK